MHQDDEGPALAVAFNRAIVAHFGAAGRADAEAVMAAGYIAGVPDPVARGVLLAQAQRTLGRMVAEVARSDAVRPRGGPR